MSIKQKAVPIALGGGALSVILTFLLNNGIATKAELLEFKAQAAEKYVPRTELGEQLAEIRAGMKDISRKLDRIAERPR